MIFDIVVAMLLGWIVGYERYYRGRVAGSQVYCLVSMTACAITAATGDLPFWMPDFAANASAELSRVVGSVITGIGFLGAGILMRTGTSIRGLTTAASVWGCATIGILVGMSRPGSAAVLTLLFVACMSALPTLEHRLPAISVYTASLRFREGYHPEPAQVLAFLSAKKLEISANSLSISYASGCFNLEFVVLAHAADGRSAIDSAIRDLPNLPHVDSFNITHSSRT